jgi:glycine/D-amino acid oxidase-like deaminating enzyme
MEAIDCLVVGQGLAGTALAFSLLEAGLTVHVADWPQPNSTSKVAAGLFNPITGRKMSKTWMAEALFPALHAFYPRLEALLGASFFHPTPIYVPFDSLAKQQEWLAKSGEPGYGAFVGDFSQARYPGALHEPFGGMLLRGSGWLDTRAFLASARAFLAQRGLLTEAKVETSELRFSEGFVYWKELKASRIVFCEGIGNRLNPFFDWLDYRPAKGEILEVEMPEAPFGEIVNRGCWMIRQPGGHFRVGSNFERSHDPAPSEQGRRQVEEKLGKLTPLPYRVVGQQAGIRPATYDRRPFVGPHPERPEVWVFGGLGSKGTSLAPYWAQRLAAHWLGGEALPPEVLPNRQGRKTTAI